MHSITFENESENQKYFWHIFYYKKRKNIAQVKEKISSVYGENALN